MVNADQLDRVMEIISDAELGPDEKDKWRPYYEYLIKDAPLYVQNEPALLALHIIKKLGGE